MKVKDCLALIRDETLWIEAPEKVRAYQAMINAEKLHLLNDKESRDAAKLIKWGLALPKGHQRLPLDPLSEQV